jgi:hypothetical protein
LSRLTYPQEGGQPGQLYLEETLRVRSVDPRDIAWEVDTPAYRVYFWSLPLGPPPSGEGRRAWSSDEYEVEDADVSAVLEWANFEASPGRTFTLYAVVHRNGTIGLVRLAGVDPTKSSISLTRDAED